MAQNKAKQRKLQERKQSGQRAKPRKVLEANRSTSANQSAWTPKRALASHGR